MPRITPQVLCMGFPKLILTSLLCLVMPGWVASQESTSELPLELIGDWSLAMDSNEPAWMRIEDNNGVPQAHFRVYIGGSGPFKISQVVDGKVVFDIKPIRKNKASKEFTKRTVHVGVVNGKLEGVIVLAPSDGGAKRKVGFSGKRVPPMPKSAPDLSQVKFGHPIALFNGKDLSGWKPYESNKINGWSVKDGMLVNETTKTDFSPTGDHANLRTVDEFEDFWLHVEFLVEEKRNSGIYLRGMYEAQVVDRDSRMQGKQGVGAIFGKIVPSVNAGKPGGQWQTYDITLVDRHVTVVLNGVKVIDNQPIDGPTAGAIYTDASAPGPIYFQGDHTAVKYKNIYLAPVVK